MIVLIAGSRRKFELVWTSKVIMLRIVDLPDISKLSKITFSGSCTDSCYIYDGVLFTQKVLYTDIRYNYSAVEFYDLNGKVIDSCALLMTDNHFNMYMMLNRNFNTDMYPNNKTSLVRHIPRNNCVRLINSMFNECVDSDEYDRIYIYSRDDIEVVGGDDDFHDVGERTFGVKIYEGNGLLS